VSNVLEGPPARAIAGEDRAITVRPEKIAMVDVEAPVGPDQCSATGRVHDVVYLGAMTRYIVVLDEGGELVVMQQNLAMSSMEALQVRDKRVRLVWSRANNRPVDSADGSAGYDLEEGKA
jgi:putative spermidine/putrescine transport system ATP-binding protein